MGHALLRQNLKWLRNFTLFTLPSTALVLKSPQGPLCGPGREDKPGGHHCAPGSQHSAKGCRSARGGKGALCSLRASPHRPQPTSRPSPLWLTLAFPRLWLPRLLPFPDPLVKCSVGRGKGSQGTHERKRAVGRSLFPTSPKRVKSILSHCLEQPPGVTVKSRPAFNQFYYSFKFSYRPCTPLSPAAYLVVTGWDSPFRQ